MKQWKQISFNENPVRYYHCRWHSLRMSPKNSVPQGNDNNCAIVFFQV
jgi:hypothetical protein